MLLTKDIQNKKIILEQNLLEKIYLALYIRQYFISAEYIYSFYQTGNKNVKDI